MPRGRELFELTRVRVLLFVREPEALFWVFVFPLVLSAVLGFAFRSRGVPKARIGLVVGDEVASAELERALARDPLIESVRFSERAEAERKLTRAAIDALVEPRPGAEPRVAFDPERAEGENARLRVLRALELEQRGGVELPVTLDAVRETGSRYVDFLYPGLLGMNLMGTGMWGIGFAVAACAGASS
jgi:hypothetical protein